MSRRQIQDSRALVTGASSGIGKDLALELARQGADVVLVARNKAKLEAVARQISDLSRRAEVVAGDITDPAVRATAIERARGVLGGLDILVNNAGVGAQGRFEDAAPQRLRRIMEVNFFAAAEMARTALPLLREGRRPIIVNIGSVLGARGIPHHSEYCASKFALQGFSDSLRAEVARLGIDVLVVNPGTTDTEFFDNVIERKAKMPWRTVRGMPSADVARRTVRAIRRGRHEIIPSFSGRLLYWLNRISPRLMDRVLSRYG